MSHMKYNSEILEQNIPLFVNLFSAMNYTDDFGYSKKWNKEIEKWLVYLKCKNNNFYDQNTGRVKKPKQRDELLGEYKAAYFIEKMQYGKILAFEPIGANQKKLDLRFQDAKGMEWFAEVKSPSWRNEVVKEIEYQFLKELKKRIGAVEFPGYQSSIPCPKCYKQVVFDVNNPSSNSLILDEDEAIKNARCESCKNSVWKLSEKERARIIKNRLDKPKHINGEGRCVNIEDAIKDSVKNAVDKFVLGKNNLLIITPDMFSDTVGFSQLFNGKQVRKIVAGIDSSKVISKVLILEVTSSRDLGKLEYSTNFINMTDCL